MKIDPCKCGSSDTEVLENGIGDFFVFCKDCKAESDQRRCESPEYAIERWNKYGSKTLDDEY